MGLEGGKGYGLQDAIFLNPPKFQIPARDVYVFFTHVFGTVSVCAAAAPAAAGGHCKNFSPAGGRVSSWLFVFVK